MKTLLLDARLACSINCGALLLYLIVPHFYFIILMDYLILVRRLRGASILGRILEKNRKKIIRMHSLARATGAIGEKKTGLC